MKPIQKFPDIIDLCACILKIFFIMFLFPMKFRISCGICSTPKLSKYTILFAFTYKPTQSVLLT